LGVQHQSLKTPLLGLKLREKAAHPIINLVRDSLRVLARD
jgi:hypothetical protein